MDNLEENSTPNTDSTVKDKPELTNNRAHKDSHSDIRELLKKLRSWKEESQRQFSNIISHHMSRYHLTTNYQGFHNDVRDLFQKLDSWRKETHCQFSNIMNSHKSRINKGVKEMVEENCLEAQFSVAMEETNDSIERVNNLSAGISDKMHIIQQLLNSAETQNQDDNSFCPSCNFLFSNSEIFKIHMKNNHSELNTGLSNHEVSSEHFRSEAIDFENKGIKPPQSKSKNEGMDMKPTCEQMPNKASWKDKGVNELVQENVPQAQFLVTTKERNDWIETASILCAEISAEMYIVKQLLNSLDTHNQDTEETECSENIDQGVERSIMTNERIYHEARVDIGSFSVVTDKELDKYSLNESSDSNLADAVISSVQWKSSR